MEHLGKEYLERVYQSCDENLQEDVIQTVLTNLERGVLMRSECLSKFFCAVLFELSEEEKKMVKELEEERCVKICHVILNHTVERGDEYTFVVAPETKEDLDYIIATGYHRALVCNNFCTEYGDVGLVSKMGGFVRIW